MEMDNSLIVKYAGYLFQVFRLYVVCEGDGRENVIERLRGRVGNWHER